MIAIKYTKQQRKLRGDVYISKINVKLHASLSIQMLTLLDLPENCDDVVISNDPLREKHHVLGCMSTSRALFTV